LSLLGVAGPILADEQLDEVEREARRLERALRAEWVQALVSQTVGAGRAPRTLPYPTGYSLSIDADLDLGGNIFKGGFPLLHSDDSPLARNVALGRLAMVSLTPYVPGPTSGTNNTALEFGLIAEEVAEVLPELVVYDEQGEPYSVRYHALAPMLLNELQRMRRQALVRDRALQDLESRLERVERR
jgi:hypothetical protein